MNEFSDEEIELYTFLKGLQGLTREKKIKMLVELKRRYHILNVKGLR